MSSTSAADARSHAVVPVSISNGVIVASFGDGDWKRMGSLGGWILDAGGYAKLC